MTLSADEMHQKVRKGRNPAFAEFMDDVYAAMTPSARRSLPRGFPGEVEAYVNGIVRYALDRLSEFESRLKRVVAETFAENPKGDRFILDPSRSNQRTLHCLFLDLDGEIVTVRSPILDLDTLGNRVLKSFELYEILTGPQAGTALVQTERSLPVEPRFVARDHGPSPAVVDVPDAVFDFLAQKESDASPKVQDPALSHVFLSHAWADKSLARRVARRLRSRGLKVWIDDVQMRPGDSLPATIEAAIRSSTHFLPLLTKSAIASKWVGRELAYARSVTDLTIVPLIAMVEQPTELLDEVLGVALHDTTKFEDALDVLCGRLVPDAPKDSRDEPAMRRVLAELLEQHPLLSSLDPTTYDARNRLIALSLDQVDLHAIETFLEVTYDLARFANTDKNGMAQLAYNIGAVFGCLGAGAHSLRHFLSTCEDRYEVHNVFSQFTDGPLADRSMIPVVQALFEACRAPHHTVLKWFVHRNFDRLSVSQRRWVVSHFVAWAAEPDDDALLTAFVFLDLMPGEEPLVHLITRWITSGKLSFEKGVLRLDRASMYFRCVNGANEDSQPALKLIVKNFACGFRALARGGTLAERLAAAELVVAAQREKYTHFRELCEEFGKAPGSAEWEALKLGTRTTEAFTRLGFALERGELVAEALTAVYQAARG